MIYLIAGLALIAIGVTLMWMTIVNLGAWLFVAMGIAEKYKGPEASFKTAWYFTYLPVPLVVAGVFLLMIR